MADLDRCSACAWPWLLALAGCAGSDATVSPEPREPRVAASPMNGARSEGEDEVVSMRVAEPVTVPVVEGDGYVFETGEVRLVVKPALGGRITELSRAGQNILTGPEVVAGGEGTLPNMYGSTFWTSPQSAWGWPPEVAIDSAPHAAHVDGAALVLSSEAGASTGYVVRKRFSADAARGAIDIEYTLVNQRATVPAAPWEISRVPKRGFVVFPATGPAEPRSTLPGAFAEGLAWVDLTSPPPGDSKLFQDGSEGWLAYVLDDTAFLKLFEDLDPADAAPGEAEIEVFTNGKYEYAEIEQQGRYSLPAPGGTASWRVSWALERVPADVDASLGSASLVAWIRSRVSSLRR